MQPHRIPGFDLARAYAIFGMYIVNFNFVFGNYKDASPMGVFLSFFSGNSSTAFVILAGIGVSLLTWRPNADEAERKRLYRVIVRRSWFLFALGMLLFLWWPADILHFYGGYMHIAALLLFVPARWLVWAAIGAVVGFHLLLTIIPYETGWNFDTLQYADFWSIRGFLRNTLYNGWNAIFPWAAFFFFGMWLGRLPWHEQRTKIRAFGWALAVFIAIQVLILMAQQGFFNEDVRFVLTSDYIPPFIPFMLAGASATVLMIAVFLWIGEWSDGNGWAKLLSQTGQMTLTHYVAHLTLGFVVLQLLSGLKYGEVHAQPLSPTLIFLYALSWFALSVVFSHFWKKRFKNGPFEALMRKVAG